jgi:hypothetical protein
MLKSAFVALSLLALSSLSALAADLAETQSLYDEGRYDEAANMGEALGTPEGLTLATKALLGKTNLLTRKERSLDDVDRAIAMAKLAFEMDPANLNAHLQYAVSQGIRGRLISKFRAQMEGLPGKAEKHLLISLELAPDHAWANAFYAAWNIEVTRGGGATLAKTMYGATLDKGIEGYDRALTLEPLSAVLPYEYAQVLLATDYYRFREKAASLLALSNSIAATNHQERAIHERVSALQAGLEADNPKLVIGLIATHLGAKKIKVPKRPR